MAIDFKDRVLELRRVRAKDLMPHPANAREHPQAQREALRAALNTIGFAGAMLAVERDGKLLICDGHLRAEELSDQEVPVLILDLNDHEVEQLLLTHDAIGALAKVNRERLDYLLSQYDAQKQTVSVEFVAEQQAALDKMLAGLAKQAGSDWGKPQEAVEDEVPEPPAVPVTQPGDLWLLGPYWSCESCGKEYSYEEGKELGECPCG